MNLIKSNFESVIKKNISLIWFTPDERINKYKEICKKYGLNWQKENVWQEEEYDDKKFFKFINELRKNDIIVMSAN